MFIVDKVLTLCLNKSWIPIGTKSAGDALSCLFSDNYLAVNVEENNGAPNFLTYSWEDWIKLPVKEEDFYVNSVRFKVKVPTIIITRNYNKVPIIETKLSYHRIAERDDYTCQYSGRKFSREEAKIQGSIDHVLPRSRGGKESWDNLVFCDKDINLNKSNKTPEEAGLKLLRNPSSRAYKIPISKTIKNINHKTWEYFIIS